MGAVRGECRILTPLVPVTPHSESSGADDGDAGGAAAGARVFWDDDAADCGKPGERGDILAVLPDGLTALDVSFVYPVALSFVAAAASTPGAAAAARDKTKVTRYRRDQADAYRFVPLSHETFGRMGKPALKFLGGLADIAARSGNVRKSRFVARALLELSCAAVRGNGLLMRWGQQRLARCSGRSFLPGDVVPTEGSDSSG